MEIVTEDERLWASGEARRFAAELGFDAEEQARAAVCVAELASNVAKYAGRGRIELEEIEGAPRALRVRAVDEGPGIADVSASVQDGVSEGRVLTPDVPLSERRGLGIGLGAVLRLMTEVRVLPRPGGGLVIEAVLRRTPERAL
jgi:serine/threonine-protein kinase RsbT